MDVDHDGSLFEYVDDNHRGARHIPIRYSPWMGTTRWVVAGAGVAVVVLYAALLALNALVLDPLAAVPGSSLAEIYRHVDAAGNSTTQDVVGVAVTAGIGVLLGVGGAVLGLVARLPAMTIAVVHLGVLAAGACATFQSMFFLAFDVADSYPVSGAAHTVWSGVLYGTSLTALVGIGVVLCTTLVRTLRRARATA